MNGARGRQGCVTTRARFFVALAVTAACSERRDPAPAARTQEGPDEAHAAATTPEPSEPEQANVEVPRVCELFRGRMRSDDCVVFEVGNGNESEGDLGDRMLVHPGLDPTSYTVNIVHKSHPELRRLLADAVTKLELDLVSQGVVDTGGRDQETRFVYRLPDGREARVRLIILPMDWQGRSQALIEIE